MLLKLPEGPIKAYFAKYFEFVNLRNTYETDETNPVIDIIHKLEQDIKLANKELSNYKIKYNAIQAEVNNLISKNLPTKVKIRELVAVNKQMVETQDKIKNKEFEHFVHAEAYQEKLKSINNYFDDFFKKYPTSLILNPTTAYLKGGHLASEYTKHDGHGNYTLNFKVNHQHAIEDYRLLKIFPITDMDPLLILWLNLKPRAETYPRHRMIRMVR